MFKVRSALAWAASLLAASLAAFVVPVEARAQEEAAAPEYPATLPEGEVGDAVTADGPAVGESVLPEGEAGSGGEVSAQAAESGADSGARPEPPGVDVTLEPPALLAADPRPMVRSSAPPVGEVGGAAPFQRKHATASFAVGAVGTSGFGAGFAGSFAWDLTERWGIELAGGVGGMQERGGGAVGGVYVDVGFIMPVTFNICASVPRVCPALDFEISILPGLAYAYLDGNHAGNVIIGFGVSSLRKTQYLDVGVRASILGYIDVVGAAVEQSADRLLGLVQLQLGCVLRWGVAQP